MNHFNSVTGGMNQVGIFRIGPSVTQVQEIRDRIDENMDISLSEFHDCVIPTSLIKLYHFPFTLFNND